MMILLRLVHVLGGIFWVGAIVFIARFLMPAIRATGPAGGAVMGHITKTGKLVHVMMSIGMLTILSGFGLVHVLAGSPGLQWFTVGMGRWIGVGAVLALVATALGMAVNAPTARRLEKLATGLQASGRAPTPEEASLMQALQRRLGRAAAAAAILLVLAAACMAVARYL